MGKHSASGRAPASAASRIRDSRRGGAEPPHSSPPSSASAARVQSPRNPTRMTRRLRCATAPGNEGTLVYLASSTRHETPKLPGALATIPEFFHPPSGISTSQPASLERKVAKSRPPLMESTAGTFSHTSHLASALSASRTNSMVRLPRGSAIPPRFPPEENDWQGVPPTRRSISPS